MIRSLARRGAASHLSVTYVGAGADVLVRVGVEELAVLGEVPLDGPVHELAVAGSRVKGDDGGGLLGALGHNLIGSHISGDAGPDRFWAAPRLPDNFGTSAHARVRNST
jgi:hypothetical protein